jgi:DNA ligase-1
MKRFAALYRALDASTASSAKQAALQAYLREADPADAAWAVYFLAGGKPRQLVPSRLLREQVARAAGLPDWLLEECYQAVGDLAETLSLLLPPGPPEAEPGLSLAQWLETRLLPLRGQAPEAQARALQQHWQALPAGQALVYFKLITGALRVGVSRQQLTQALAVLSGLPAALITQRLMGYTLPEFRPGPADYLALLAPEDAAAAAGQPYPFQLAQPLDPVQGTAALSGARGDWLAEWKWDGIRAQLLRRKGGSWLWSRGEELIGERFPELLALAERLPAGTVLDGEILVWPPDAARPAGFAALQRRLGRQKPAARLLRELPVCLCAYDLLEWQGRDVRAWPLAQRRAQLGELLAGLDDARLRLSPLVEAPDWAQLAAARAQARERGVEGLMLKPAASPYGVGRVRGPEAWWKWKLAPLVVDAVLVYAQRGHGRRASLYTDYTFAVWSDPPEVPGRRLLPLAKAYSGLSDAEIREVDALIRRHTVESFGPVRSVAPLMVFELGFEGLAESPRHKSGLALRFPRMLRWRQDKPPEEADCLSSLRALLPTPAEGPA